VSPSASTIGPAGLAALPWLTIAVAIAVAAVVGTTVHFVVERIVRHLGSRPAQIPTAAALGRHRKPLVVTYALATLLGGLHLIGFGQPSQQLLTSLFLVALAAALLWTMLAARATLS